MNTIYGWSIVYGIIFGVGIWSIVSLLPRFGHLKLHDRIAPFVVDISSEARGIVSRSSPHPIPVLGTLLTPAFLFLRDRVSGVLGGTSTIKRRLRQARLDISVEQFRSQQLLWAAGGFTLGVIVVIIATPMYGLPLVFPIIIPLVMTLFGFFSRGHALQHRAKKRMARIVSELPTVLEFLTLSLAAGESILDALRRVVASSSGELSAEFRGVLTNTSMGVSLAESLRTVERELSLSEMTRCVDQIVGAIERGTPLADVLRAQALDARTEAKRMMIELAGRKEVAMLVPLVFLILPLSVCFAVFPGIFVIQSTF
jgi:tight adherence protein C